MKKILLFLSVLILNYGLKSQNVPNPYASIGKPAPKVATVSNGAYDEFFTKEGLVLINNNAISRKTGDIVFSQKDHPEIIAQLIKNEEDKFRFLSTDPIAYQYPELTPYQFASNTPIAGIELDGLEMTFYSNDPKKQPTVKNQAEVQVSVTENGFTMTHKIPYNLSDVGVNESFIQHDGKWLRLPKGFTNTDYPKDDEEFMAGLQTFEEFNTEYNEKVNKLIQNVTLGVNVAKVIGPGLAKSLGIFGARGVKLNGSRTIKNFKDNSRIDIENPSPGKGTGNVHYQDNSGGKYYFNPKDKSFYKKFKDNEFGDKVSDTFNKKLTGNKDIQKGIDKALKYLGEEPAFKK